MDPKFDNVFSGKKDENEMGVKSALENSLPVL
jgi:hypothetical protein